MSTKQTESYMLQRQRKGILCTKASNLLSGAGFRCLESGPWFSMAFSFFHGSLSGLDIKKVFLWNEKQVVDYALEVYL